MISSIWEIWYCFWEDLQEMIKKESPKALKKDYSVI
jgi:hypothetical protein